MCELCWIMGILYMIYGIDSWMMSVRGINNEYISKKTIFNAIWGIANGPLAWACLI